MYIKSRKIMPKFSGKRKIAPSSQVEFQRKIVKTNSDSNISHFNIETKEICVKTKTIMESKDDPGKSKSNKEMDSTDFTSGVAKTCEKKDLANIKRKLSRIPNW